MVLAGMGLKETVTQFVGVMGLTWAGSQLTKVGVTMFELWGQPALAHELLRSKCMNPASVLSCSANYVT